METKNGNIAELSDESLENVSGGTTNPEDLNLIIKDYRAKNPTGSVEDLLNQITTWQSYSIETDGDVRPFRFFYDADSKEMNFVLNYLKTHF